SAVGRVARHHLSDSDHERDRGAGSDWCAVSSDTVNRPGAVLVHGTAHGGTVRRTERTHPTLRGGRHTFNGSASAHAATQGLAPPCAGADPTRSHAWRPPRGSAPIVRALPVAHAGEPHLAVLNIIAP